MTTPLKVITLGDSITQGRMFDAQAMADRLETLLGLNVVNLGKGGDTVAQTKTRYLAYAHLDNDQMKPLGRTINCRYDVVIVCIGTNDLSNGSNGATVSAAVEDLLDTIAADGPRIIPCTIPPRAGWSGHTADIQTALEFTNASIVTWAETNNEDVIDLYARWGDPNAPTFLDSSFNYGDGLHGNGDAFQDWAEAAYALLS